MINQARRFPSFFSYVSGCFVLPLTRPDKHFAWHVSRKDMDPMPPSSICIKLALSLLFTERFYVVISFASIMRMPRRHCYVESRSVVLLMVSLACLRDPLDQMSLLKHQEFGLRKPSSEKNTLVRNWPTWSRR